MDMGKIGTQTQVSTNSDIVTIHNVKVVLLGDCTVGKSSLAARFARNIFGVDYLPTVGAGFVSKAIEVKDTCMIMQIWDTAGQERFKSLLPMYLRGADAAILVYDVTELESFEHVGFWLDQLSHYVEKIPVALVGNKIDLDDVVDDERAEKYAGQHNLIFCKASAKSGENIETIFKLLGSEVLKRAGSSGPKRQTAGLRSGKQRQKKRCCDS